MLPVSGRSVVTEVKFWWGGSLRVYVLSQSIEPAEQVRNLSLSQTLSGPYPNDVSSVSETCYYLLKLSNKTPGIGIKIHLMFL